MSSSASISFATTQPALTRARPQESLTSRLGFILFILVNACFFARPSDLFLSLEGWRIYEALMASCVLVSLPQVLREYAPGSLKRWAISFCVVGMIPAIALSHMSHFRFYPIFDLCLDFFKTTLYFILLVVHVNSLERFRTFLLSIALFTITMAVLSLLQYHNFINIPSLTIYYEGQEDMVDEETGEPVLLGRLCSLGFFNNPNDLARILIAAIFMCLSFMGDQRRGARRFAWILPILILGYATALTYSRGGFLGLLAGVLVLCYMKYGKYKTVLAAGVVFPLLFFVYSGRQTNIDINEGTGHQRILLWRDGLNELFHSPIFGTGMDTYSDITGGLIAHNSFVQAFTELGLFGGTLFFGLFYFGMVPLFTLGKDAPKRLNSELYRLRPYILAMLISYAVGMLSSARVYTITTYTLIGIGAAYCRLIAVRMPEAIKPISSGVLRRLAVASFVVLLGHYLLVRFSA